MHQSSYNIMMQFRNLVTRHFEKEKISILDVGSYGVNGTYKEIFSDEKMFCYTGLDLKPGPNVDYVPHDPYDWPELENESYDVVISGQAFEHIEYPWLVIRELAAKLRKNGLACIVAPSRGPEHKYPVDCWRYYPDGFYALAKWAGLEILEAKTNWGASGFSDGSDQWGDTFCILYKPENHNGKIKPQYTRRIAFDVNHCNNPLRSNKKSSYYGFARGEVIDALVNNKVPARTVLEIGCAAGATGKTLKEKLSVDTYVGIELSKEAAEIAEQYLDRVIYPDIEKTDLKKEYGLQYGEFDLLLALDVLEHLYDPWDILVELSQYVKPGGYVVASIPNVQNITVVQDLIHGRWKYEDAGILDATHLRFFTLEETKQLFVGAGLAIKSIEHVLNPPLDLEKLKDTGNNFKKGNIDLSDLSKEEVVRLFTYQYIIIAQKKPSHKDVKSVFEAQEDHKDSTSAPAFRKAQFQQKNSIKGLTSIVILTLNQLEYTKKCVKSLRKHTPEPHEIIFVDNGSTDGTVKWLEKLAKENENTGVIQNRSNLGFAKGCNQGIAASRGEYILLLNNDVIVTDNWLSGMIECLNSASNTGIVGPMTNNISGPQQVISSEYRSVDYLSGYAAKFREKNRHRHIPSKRIVGFCMLFRRKLAEEIGWLDESFGTGNFEDDDFCLRASLEGYTNLISGDVFIHHYGGRSFIGNKIDYTSVLRGNKKIYDEKWRNINVATELGVKVAVYNAIDNARELFHRQEFDNAVRALIKGLEYAPQAEAIYYYLAEILIDAKLFKDAIEALSSLPEKAKSTARSIALAGYCKVGSDFVEEAADLVDRAILLDPAYAPAINLKGIIAYKKGEQEEAQKLFQQAIAADPGYGEPYTNLGVLKWSQNEHKDGLDLLEKGFILAPTVTDIATLYQQTVTSLGEFTRAEKICREAKTLHPLNKTIAFMLIDFLNQQTRPEDTVREAEQAIITFGAEDCLLSLGLDVRSRLGALEISKEKIGSKALSLCMIVKNEERYLPKCLMSVQPIVDEIIVVDTGSSDKTREIAKLYGAKVYDIDWNGNFSEARNFSLSKACGDWILVLDADEVVSAQDHALLRSLIQKRHQKPVAYTIVTRNYTNILLLAEWIPNNGQYPGEEAGNGWCPSSKVRLFPRDNRIRFEGYVHELMEASINTVGLEIRPCPVVIHHYGKLDHAKVLAKGKDYYLMGKEKLAGRADDVMALYELATQAQELERFDEALELWQKIIGLTKDRPVADFFMNLGYTYLKLKQYENSRIASKTAMAAEPNMKEAVLNYAYCELLIGDHKQALPLLKRTLQKNPEYQPVLVLMAAAYAIDGDKDQAKDFLTRSLKEGFISIPPLNILAEQLISTGRIDDAQSILEVMIENNHCDQESIRLFEICKENKASPEKE